MNRIVALIVTVLATAEGLAAQPLIGDPVPPLGDQVKWLQGPPTPEFHPGRIYLLDFWATWCPPCYPMLDQLSELQDRYRERGLVVIGIAVGTDMGVPLPRFLETEGQRISYSIAEPEDEEQLKTRLVHTSIMNPAELGLPFVMIVDRQGRLAWTSDPGGPDDALEEVVAAVMNDTFDLTAHAGATRLEREQLAETAAGLERVAELREQGRLADATRALLPIAERLPRQYAGEAVALFQDVLCAGQGALAAGYGRALLDGVLRERVDELVQAERTILALPAAGGRDLALAESMTRRALELKGGDHPDFLFEIAKVLAAQGRSEEAESFRQRAASAAQDQGWQPSYIGYISRVDLERAVEHQTSQLKGLCDTKEQP